MTRRIEPTPDGIIGEYLRQAHVIAGRFLDRDAPQHQVHVDACNTVNALGIVALMAELERVAPHRATAVARLLVGHWEDGSTVFELLAQWHEDHAAGRPVGFGGGL